MWVKPRVQTRNTLTDWRTTREAQGCSKTKMVFLLFHYWRDINSSWPVAESYTHTTQIHVHYISKLTHSYYDYILGLCQPGAEKAQTAKLSGLHLFSSLNLPSPCQSVSLFFWNSLLESAKLHCHVTLTSQIKWHVQGLQPHYNFNTITTASIIHLTQPQIISITIPKMFKNSQCHLPSKPY